MLKLLLVVATFVALQQPSPPPPGTDIYELSLTGGLDSLKRPPEAIATEPGYDNQPYYTPDGARLLFTANRDGKQTDIYALDRKSRRVQRLTSTPESEYSPALTADGEGISVIRVEADGTQRLWRFDLQGANPRLVLSDIRPVGYHAWIDRDRLALFVLGKPATLQLAHVSTGKSSVVAEGIGRSLHRIPNTSAVSFVHVEGPGNVWVKQLDPATGEITPLVRAVEGSSERDVAWTPDGMLLMSSGTRIFSWQRGQEGWREGLDVSGSKLGAVTRMAMSPDGRALAIVVNEAR